MRDFAGMWRRWHGASGCEKSNTWRGYQANPIPANPGTIYYVRGAVLRSPVGWKYGTYYACPYIGWERPMTARRENVVSLTFGDLGNPYFPYMDPAFTNGLAGFPLLSPACSGFSTYLNFGSTGYFANITDPLDAAPAGTQGTHMNVHAAGNTFGSHTFTAGSLGEMNSCDTVTANPEAINLADPINALSGGFWLTEHDLGVKTGCRDINLKFERSYNVMNIGAGSLSAGWVHNYEQRISVFGSYILLQRPRGSVLTYKDVGGPVYASQMGDTHKLIRREGGGWALIAPDRRVDLFDAQGRLIAQQDPNGNTIWLTYETVSRNGTATTRLARVDAPGGRYLWFGYDYYRPQRLIQVGDSSGRTVRFQYDDQEAYNFGDTGRLIGVTDAMGVTATYGYSSTFLLATKTDGMGNRVFTNTFDASGRVSRQVNNTGLDLRLQYAVITDTAEIARRVGSTEGASLGALLTTTATDQLGAQSVYTYGSDGLLRTVQEPSGAITRYGGYTTTRNATRITDALGNVTQLTYDERGLPTSATNALGQTTSVSYNAWGLPSTISDTLGQQYTLAYSGPNLTSVRDAAGASVDMSYATQAGWAGMLTTMAQSGSMTTTLTYTANGDVGTVSDALGRTTSLAYDMLGRVGQIVTPQHITTTLAYDAEDRVRSVTVLPNDPALPQRTTVYTYNVEGQLIASSDPLGATTRATYDAAGRVLTQTQPDGRTTQFAYDARGVLTALTPPGRAAHQFTLTPDTLVTQYLPPALTPPAPPETVTSSATQARTTWTRPNGQTSTATGDALGRTTVITRPDGLLTIAYDPTTGNLQQVTAPNGTSLTLTSTDHARRVTQTWSGPVAGQVTQQANLRGQLVTQQVNTLPTVAFSYAASGALTQAGALTLAYAPAAGTLTSTTLGALTDVWQYEGTGMPRQITTQITGTALFDLAFTYRADGRIATRTETEAGQTTTLTYGYDAAGQLVRVDRNGVRTEQYAYDTNGTRTTTTANGQTWSSTVDAQDRLRTAGNRTYTYTPNGERATQTVGGATTSYRYDPLGALVGATLPDGTVVDYLVDGLGRRIGKRVNGALVQGFLYQDALAPVAELDGSGAVVSQFVYGTRANIPDYLIRGGKTYRIVTDQLGSVRRVVDTASGAVVQARDYDTWGNVLRDTAPGFQPFGFAGGLEDRDTGLVHFGAREYDPVVGRWTTKDPLGFDAGDTNLYGYVGNDPVNVVDPTGLDGDPWGDLILRRTFALSGGFWGGAGTFIGLLVSRGNGAIECFWSDRLWLDVLIGTFTGGLTGYFAPGMQTGKQAGILSALSNGSQYFLTTGLHGNFDAAMRPGGDIGGWFKGLGFSMGLGFGGGVIGGPYTQSAIPFSLRQTIYSTAITNMPTSTPTYLTSLNTECGCQN